MKRDCEGGGWGGKKSVSSSSREGERVCLYWGVGTHGALKLSKSRTASEIKSNKLKSILEEKGNGNIKQKKEFLKIKNKID